METVSLQGLKNLRALLEQMKQQDELVEALETLRPRVKED